MKDLKKVIVMPPKTNPNAIDIASHAFDMSIISLFDVVKNPVRLYCWYSIKIKKLN